MTVQLSDVKKQKSFEIVRHYGLTSAAYIMAFFVPRCEFPEPEVGQVWLKYSFPLSRFSSRKSTVDLHFAVGGAYEDDLVNLF